MEDQGKVVLAAKAPMDKLDHSCASLPDAFQAASERVAVAKRTQVPGRHLAALSA